MLCFVLFFDINGDSQSKIRWKADGTAAAPPPEESARMDAAPDRSIGFFSAVYSRLRASACRRNDAHTHTHLHPGQEAAVARRPGDAAAAPLRSEPRLRLLQPRGLYLSTALRFAAARIPSNSPSILFMLTRNVLITGGDP